MLARRSRKRLKKYVDEMMQSEPQGLSLLERKAITAKTEQYYNQEYGELKAFISGRRLTFSTAPQKDVGINAYFNHLFLEGHPAHKGEKILASFMHQNPDFSRYGSQKLPRTYRALKGWRRLSPGTSRKAWPLAVWCAVVSEMKRLGQLQMALFTMLGLSSYSRPSELLRCRVFSLVRPAPSVTEHWCLLLNPEEHPARSKTGTFDDSLVLDSAYLRPWSAPLMRQLTSRPNNQMLWDFDYGQYAKVFGQIARQMGIDITPYQLRHSGPSIDRSRNSRSLLEVQKRGRWKSHKSVARYEKSGRLAANFQMLPVVLQQHCLAAESHLVEVMLGQARAPKLPSLPKA